MPPRSRDYEIVKNNPKIYLINAVGDGDCFINAIFDYCLYTGTLEAMYNRMIHIELLIASKYAKYGEGIKKAKEFAISADGVDVLDWDNTLINYVKNKYYHRRTGKLKASIDVNILLDEYMKIYAETDGYFTGDDQIFIFRKILFKKINLKNTSNNKAAIPRFWLNYETIQSVSNLTKIVKFRKTAGTYKFIEKDGGIYKYISLLRDGEHYLLFVAKKFLIL